MSAPTLHPVSPHAAVVWVGPWHARVARSEEGHPTMIEVDRGADPQLQYLLRVARETEDCDRLMILGPSDARLAFEREYVALYQRPDRLLDVETAASATTADLTDRLRLLDRIASTPQARRA